MFAPTLRRELGVDEPTALRLSDALQLNGFDSVEVYQHASDSALERCGFSPGQVAKYRMAEALRKQPTMTAYAEAQPVTAYVEAQRIVDALLHGESLTAQEIMQRGCPYQFPGAAKLPPSARLQLYSLGHFHARLRPLLEKINCSYFGMYIDFKTVDRIVEDLKETADVSKTGNSYKELNHCMRRIAKQLPIAHLRA